MTVPPLFGWEVILTVVALVVAVAVVFLLVLAAGPADTDRSEWQAWLDARSGRSPDLGDGSAEGARPGADTPGRERTRSSA
jgi:hypothetical protein